MKAALGKKIGMVQIFESNGAAVIGTAVDLSEGYVARKTKDVNGNNHVELAYGKQKKPSKSQTGTYKEIGYVPLLKKDLKVAETSELMALEAGKTISPEIFVLGEKVEISGVTKGKGFAGVVKRYKMKGGPRTHGQSDRERAIGSIGMRTIPGRVWKGKRMAGHMGTINKTIKGLKVSLIDAENNLIVVSGSIPGAKGSLVLIKSK